MATNKQATISHEEKQRIVQAYLDKRRVTDVASVMGYKSISSNGIPDHPKVYEGRKNCYFFHKRGGIKSKKRIIVPYSILQS